MKKTGNLFYLLIILVYLINFNKRQDLVNQGFLAKPYCIELRCKMSSIFEIEYEGKKGN